MNETRSARSAEPVLYVYDRVCTKDFKQREILREYGGVFREYDNASREPRYDSSFADAEKRRAEEASMSDNAPSRPRRVPAEEEPPRSGSRTAAREGEGTRTYQFRPGRPDGGEAVEEELHRRVPLEWFVNLFISPEERGRVDEEIARRRAVAVRKLHEHRQIFLTVLFAAAVTLLIGFGIYKLFFVVRDIRVTGAESVSESEVLAVAGFGEGDNLYSFRASDTADRITFYCPYIRSVKVNRTIPTSVTLAVEEDTPAYCADIWGDCVLLSAGLRVLEVGDADTVSTDGLIRLILPPVDTSVAGRVLTFTGQRSERYIRDVLAAVGESAMREDGLLDSIDLTNEYDITMLSAGRYSLRFGGEADMDLKLRLAYATIHDDAFEKEFSASIDLSAVGEASVRYDLRREVSGGN